MMTDKEKLERLKFRLWVSYDLEQAEQQMFEDFTDMKVKEIEQFNQADLDFWDFVVMRPKRLAALIHSKAAAIHRAEEQRFNTPLGEQE